MAKKLFVGGIKREASQQDIENALREAFGQFGEVSEVDVIIDRATGQCKGFCFVAMNDDAQADEAIAKLNNSVIEGITFRSLTVNEARPKEERRPFHSNDR